ncbi:hypothetical protein BGX20_007939 [Mortierella sp. AD010]|nr:hypothetical protein BGX20_007939 [Mortierella sp. AD010]
MFNGYEWHGRPLEVREDVNKLAETLGQRLAVREDSENKDDANDATVTSGDLTSSENTNGVQDSTTQADSLDAAAATAAIAAKAAAQKRTVHVGNIPFRMRWQDLKDLFRKAGRVVRADVALGPDNRSRGFGTVVFSTEEEAKKAIAMFDQYHWQDRVIQVQEDRSNLENGRHQEGGHAHGMGPGPHHGGPYFRNQPPMNHNFVAGRQVFVGNLPFQCQWQDLKDLFRKAGDIIRADVALGYDGRSRGFGSVLFTTPEDATTAITMFDNYDFNGRFLKVHYDRFTPMGHGPPMHGHMMHPHPHPHHQPHHHPHRLHPMHAQHGHGFPPNFHQPPMMPLGAHPMIHGANAPGQFNMGPHAFGGRNFSPSLLGPGSVHAAEFTPTDGSVGTNTSPLPTDLPGLALGSNDNRVTSPPQFDSGSTSTIVGGIVSPTPSSSVGISGAGAIAFPSGPGPLLPLHPGSPSQQYPFLPHLGPIGKPNHNHGHLNEHPGSGLLSNTSSSTSGIPISEVGPSSGDDFVPRNTGNPYHFGNSIGQNSDGDESVSHDADAQQEMGYDIHNANHIGDAFSPGFYMYPGFLQTPQPQQQQQQQHHQHQQSPQLQQQHSQQLQQQQQQQHSPSQQPHDQHQQAYQQHQPLGYPLYQDQYLQDQPHLGHPRNGVIGGLGTNGPGHGHGHGHTHGHSHGYPSQPEWVAHPNSFMMGPFQPMYGLPQFEQYGHHRGLNGEIAVEAEGGSDAQHNN